MTVSPSHSGLQLSFFFLALFYSLKTSEYLDVFRFYTEVLFIYLLIHFTDENVPFMRRLHISTEEQNFYV